MAIRYIVDPQWSGLIEETRATDNTRLAWVSHACKHILLIRGLNIDNDEITAAMKTRRMYEPTQ